MSRSFMNNKLEARYLPEKGGYGVYATAPIEENEVLCIWGGNIWSYEEFSQLPEENQSHGIQVDEDHYQTYGLDEAPESADYVNHSCEPNAGLQGPITLVAMRSIEIGEEICFDYAMSDGTPYDEFTCGCATPACRGIVTGNDWQLSELQLRYANYLSPYLQRRIRSYQVEHLDLMLA